VKRPSCGAAASLFLTDDAQDLLDAFREIDNPAGIRIVNASLERVAQRGETLFPFALEGQHDIGLPIGLGSDWEIVHFGNLTSLQRYAKLADGKTGLTHALDSDPDWLD
jgi:hypothetical protein